MYPEVIAGIAETHAGGLGCGTPLVRGELRPVAPEPGGLADAGRKKMKRLDAEEFDWSQETIRAIEAPTLLIFGDADVVRPEHMVEVVPLARRRSAGRSDRSAKSRLAMLPGTTHVTVMEHIDWLLPMITEFLDEPCPETS